MARLYHHAPQRDICAEVLAVCRVDLVLRVGVVDVNRYPKSRKGWPVESSLDRSKFFSATLSCGGGGVASGRFGPVRTVWSCGVPECLSDPSRAVWSGVCSLQKVAKVEDVIYQSVT